MSSRAKRVVNSVRRRVRPAVDGLEARVTPSTFKVNSLLDFVATDLRSGKGGNGQISLRSAIQAANAKGGTNTIIVPQGTILLSIAGPGEDASAQGDLDVTRGKLTIRGQGATRTIVDGNSLDRVLEVLGGNVTVAGLTIQHGRVENEGGGGILKQGGSLTLASVQVLNNTAVGIGGVIGSAGAPGTRVGGDGGRGSDGAAGQGGGIFNASGNLALSQTTFSGNRALGGDGGDGGSGGTANAGAAIPGTNGQSANGGAGGAGGVGGDARGGGIFNAAGASLSLSRTTIAGNTAFGGQGGAGGNGGSGFARSGGDDNGGVGFGGDAASGAGGAAGRSGSGLGGGIFNLGRVTASGAGTLTFASNTAHGFDGSRGGNSGGLALSGVGGNGLLNDAGGPGGSGAGGAGGDASPGAIGEGGGLFNGSGATVSISSTVLFASNLAQGGDGGAGGLGGAATGGHGGTGGTGAGNISGAGGIGGSALGGRGGNGGSGASGAGGAIFNDEGGTVTFSASKGKTPPAAGSFTGNQAVGGKGGSAGPGGAGNGASGGDGGGHSAGGAAGKGVGGAGGSGGRGGAGLGGVVANFGTATFTGLTENLTSNTAAGGAGGNGFAGGNGSGGKGGGAGDILHAGGKGGDATGGNGGDGGDAGNGLGGAVFNQGGSTLTIDPRRGAKKGSSQAKALNQISANRAIAGAPAGIGGASGGANAGQGGRFLSLNGTSTPGASGAGGTAGLGTGGGLDLIPSGVVLLANVTVTGNTASTSDNDIAGTFTK